MANDRWYNPLMRWLLRSPFHGLVSRGVLLLTFSGRKSGRTYCTPISYSQSGSELQLITHRGRAWWRNLEGGVPVIVRLRGKDRPAVASVVDASRDELSGAIREVYPGMPATRAAPLLEQSVLIRLHLTEVGEQRELAQAR